MHARIFFFFFFAVARGMRDLSSQTPAVEAQSFNHWTAREVPGAFDRVETEYKFPVLNLIKIKITI